MPSTEFHTPSPQEGPVYCFWLKHRFLLKETYSSWNHSCKVPTGLFIVIDFIPTNPFLFSISIEQLFMVKLLSTVSSGKHVFSSFSCQHVSMPHDFCLFLSPVRCYKLHYVGGVHFCFSFKKKYRFWLKITLDKGLSCHVPPLRRSP